MIVCDWGQKSLWNDLIDSEADIYYQWNYVDAFFKLGDGRPKLLFLSDGFTKIYNVFLLRKLSDLEVFRNLNNNNGMLDIVTPYGYGGTVMQGKTNGQLLNQFFSEADAYCKTNRIVSEFVRFDPLSCNVRNYQKQPYECVALTQTVCMQMHTEEQIWNGMKSECRNRIKKACRSNITVSSGFDEFFMTVFRKIYNETMARNKAAEYYYFNEAFYDSMLSNLQNNAKIYIAWCGGQPVSAILIIFSAGNACYHLGGSVGEYMKIGANNLLFYEAAKDLLSMGNRTLQLGGGYAGSRDTLFQYKKSLCPNGVQDCYVGKRIYEPELYNELVELKIASVPGFDSKTGFFPAYRA